MHKINVIAFLPSCQFFSLELCLGYFLSQIRYGSVNPDPYQKKLSATLQKKLIPGQDFAIKIYRNTGLS